MSQSSNYNYVPYQVMDSDGVSLRSVLLRYGRNWYWFLLSVAGLLLVAFLFLRYQHPTYSSRASVLVKDEKKGIDSENMLKELEIFAPKKVVENETEILKSYTLMDRVVKQLHLDVQYFHNTPFGRREVYEQAPVRLIVEKASPGLYQNDDPIELSFVSPTTVQIAGHPYPVNTSVETPYGRLRVFTRRPISAGTEPLFVRIATPTKVVTDYLRVLKAEPTSKASTVIVLSLETGVGDKGEAILNRLIDVYNEAAVMDKNRVAANTMHFIEERLQLVARELESVERNVQNYKSAQGITDLSLQAQGFLETVQKNDAELNGVTVRLGALRDLEDYVSQQPGNRVPTPATVGLDDPTLVKLITEATALESQRAELLQTVPRQHPLVTAVDNQLKLVKANIGDNVGTMRSMLSTARQQYVQTNRKIESTIRTIPVKERNLMNITRQQAIKNDLYTYLLKKREETAVSYASAISDSRVVDVARSDAKPVKPNRQLTFLLFGLLGLLIPVMVLATRDAVNNRVMRRTEVEEGTQVPILGEIVRKKQPGSLVVATTMHSVIAEQIRSLRTNLSFLRDSREGSQVLLFTSSINGEGKSFLSLNLGASLALTGAKTVILEMDLRKPQLRNSLNFANSTGLSNYLIGETTLDEIIRPVPEFENYYIITSGALPPNPSELLGNPRLEELMRDLRTRFSYVIIDAPPIGLVTDAQLIAPFVDATLYVVRHDVTPKHYLKMVEMLYREKRFNKLNIVLNDVSNGESNYYSYQSKYGYGYGGEPEKKTFLSRFRPTA